MGSLPLPLSSSPTALVPSPLHAESPCVPSRGDCCCSVCAELVLSPPKALSWRPQCLNALGRWPFLLLPLDGRRLLGPG